MPKKLLELSLAHITEKDSHALEQLISEADGQSDEWNFCFDGPEGFMVPVSLKDSSDCPTTVNDALQFVAEYDPSIGYVMFHEAGSQFDDLVVFDWG